MAQALADRERRGSVSDDIPIHELSPQAASQRLAQMQAKYDASTAPAAPTDKPTTAAEAKVRLDHLSRDPKWGEKLIAGDTDTLKGFRDLSALAAEAQPGDQLDRVIAGTAERPMMETVTDGQLSTGKLMSAVEGLREIGLSDDAIKEAINGGKNSAVIHRAVQELKTKLFGDPAWVKRYLDGGAIERRQATLISIALNSEVAE
jgi:hypothetical protein